MRLLQKVNKRAKALEKQKEVFAIKKIIKFISAVTSVAVLATGAVVLGLSAMMPDCYYVAQGESLSIKSELPITATGLCQTMPVEVYSRAGNSYKLNLTLSGGPVIKQVDVKVVPRSMVIPGGSPFGIKMFTEGVMVVGMSDIDVKGKVINPAKDAGIKTGDIILKIGNKAISRNEEVGKLIAQSAGKTLSLDCRRGEQSFTTELIPQQAADGSYKAGMWVRDSSAGIGTMTFYDPETRYLPVLAMPYATSTPAASCLSRAARRWM